MATDTPDYLCSLPDCCFICKLVDYGFDVTDPIAVLSNFPDHIGHFFSSPDWPISRNEKKKTMAWVHADPMIRIYFLYFLFLLIPFSFRIRFFIFETERELEPVQITFFSEGILIHLGTVCRSEECGSLVFR